MSTYRVVMEHWQRHEPSEGATFIESIEVIVDAPTGNAAAVAAQRLLGSEWRTRVVRIEAKKFWRNHGHADDYEWHR